MNFVKQLAGQTIIYGMGTIVPRVLSYLLLTPFYTRIFQQAEYGIVVELYAYSAFFLILLTYGMETGFFRFNQNYNNKQKVYATSLFTLLFTSVLFVFIIFSLSDKIANIIKYQNHIEYIKWLAIIIASDAFVSIPFARLRAENKSVKFSIIKIINISIIIGLNIFYFVYCPDHYENSDFVKLVYNPEVGVGYAFLSNMVASIITILMLLPEILSVKGMYDFQLLKKMLKYSLPLLIVGLAGMINEVADKIFIKYLTLDGNIAMKMVGIYGANYKLAVLMTLFIQMFRYAAEPFFFEKEKEKDAKLMYAVVMKYFIISGLGIFLIVMLYMNIFKYFIDVKFHEGLVIVPIVLAANLCFGIYYNLSVWYKLSDRTSYGAAISVVGAIITIVLNILLIPKIGYIGSAWATLVCYFAMMIISYFLGQKHFKIHYDKKSIAIYAGVGIIIYSLASINMNYHLINSMLLNTFLFISFVLFTIYREKKEFFLY